MPRLYHVATDIEKFYGNWGDVVAIWNGGLGIPGGLLLGLVVGMYVTHRRGIGIAVAGDVRGARRPAGPGDRSVGQLLQPGAVRPADRPAVGAADRRRATSRPAYAVGTTFHPTFLYESLWCLGLCLVLLWIDRRWRPAPGQLFAMYVMGYGIGRFWVEGMRIDEADQVAGLRFNQWVAITMIVGGAVALAIMRMYPVRGTRGRRLRARRCGRRRLAASRPTMIRSRMPADDVSPDVDPIPSRTDEPTPTSE